MMTDKGLNIFEDCNVECVHVCPQEEWFTPSSWEDNKMYTTGKIVNSQRAPTKHSE